MKLRVIDSAVAAMMAFATPAFSQAISASTPVTNARTAQAAQPAGANAEGLSRHEQAARAGYVCGSRAYPDSTCQTPTTSTPR